MLHSKRRHWRYQIEILFRLQIRAEIEEQLRRVSFRSRKIDTTRRLNNTDSLISDNRKGDERQLPKHRRQFS